jgi:hypothetical protein
MAQTLSKTGITNGSTIQVGHVTQSIDALTGTVAYDITISGSLTTTGSVLVDGNVTIDGDITGSSFTGSFVGFHTGSATLTGSFTGSLDGNSTTSTTSTYVASSPQNYLPNPGGAFVGPGNLGLIAGSTTLSSGVSPVINPAALTGKVFQTQYWVTTTKASGSTSPSPGTLFIEEPTPGGGAFLIKETGASSNDDVNFIIVYLS